MSDYLKEAERLLDELRTCTLAEATHYASPDFKRAKASEEAANRARAALLAHIQRGAVPEGWKEATIAWEVCASIHREYAKKKDPFFTTRQADFVKHTEAARAAMLAAAPAPDHFRDAAEMVAEPADDRIASAIHYPECWDTAAYPTVESALSEVFAHYRCTEHDAPGEVPMPEPDATLHDDGYFVAKYQLRTSYDFSRAGWRLDVISMATASTYGAACEAAGYARGLRDAMRDAERYRWLRRHFAIVGTDNGAVFHALNLPTPTHIAPDAAIELDASIDAALRGEVKP